ncbi:MAG TPA: DUF1828 domain-containing protein [Pyrinomonadaceae bacterium]|nr:DUF1828 domain-containing protein [Pyrinomonadaceae bacterium]HMP65756.1 DUF1828 domain-containing protein [Pyrinomonadaceae bacterium]
MSDGNACAISTPFLDRHNDHVEVYLTKTNGNIRISDQGNTIADLKMSGFEVSTPKREQILKTTLNGFGVHVGEGNELYVDANQHNIGQKKHYLLQAIIAVNDMFNLAQETVYSLFKEDVEAFLRSSNVVFSKDIKITGKSGFDHNIDFLIPQSTTYRERLIKAVNTPKKDPIMSAIMAFTDIEQARETPTTQFVIYNDSERTVSSDVINAMVNYDIKPIPWSLRQEHRVAFSLN